MTHGSCAFALLQKHLFPLRQHLHARVIPDPARYDTQRSRLLPNTTDPTCKWGGEAPSLT